MGENKNSGNKSEIQGSARNGNGDNNANKKASGGAASKNAAPMSALVATVVVVLLAVAAVVVLFVLPKNKAGDDNSDLSGGTAVTFKPTQALIDECGAKAQELIQNNYKTVRLFVSEGLDHEPEPYGNSPEGGYYTVKSDEYKVYEDIRKFVRSVYVEQEAERILTQMPADPKAAITAAGGNIEHIAVFGTREIYVDADDADSYVPDSDASAVSEPVTGEPSLPEIVVPDPDAPDDPEESEPADPAAVKVNVLGINEKFKPYSDYGRPWGSISIKIFPVNEEECNVTVYLGANKDVDVSSVDENDILRVTMVRENGEWRLTKLIY